VPNSHDNNVRVAIVTGGSGGIGQAVAERLATSFFLGSNDQSTVDTLAGMTALGRLGQPQDIAEVVSFLAGPARWINGQVLYADGRLILG
jgi:NAD(P)-dependent dehydrogenase (short-subunit alcohol dehydrogenase family)